MLSLQSTVYSPQLAITLFLFTFLFSLFTFINIVLDAKDERELSTFPCRS